MSLPDTCWILEDKFTTFLDLLYKNGNSKMNVLQLCLSFIKYCIEELEQDNDIYIGYIINKYGDIDKEFKRMVYILLDAMPERLNIDEKGSCSWCGLG